MTIMARWSGECPECGGRWGPGDLIRAGEDRQWVHAHCPETLPDEPASPCPVCWLVHPVGACDR